MLPQGNIILLLASSQPCILCWGGLLSVSWVLGVATLLFSVLVRRGCIRKNTRPHTWYVSRSWGTRAVEVVPLVSIRETVRRDQLPSWPAFQLWLAPWLQLLILTLPYVILEAWSSVLVEAKNEKEKEKRRNTHYQNEKRVLSIGYNLGAADESDGDCMYTKKSFCGIFAVLSYHVRLCDELERLLELWRIRATMIRSC